MQRERTVASKCLLKQQKYEGYNSFQALTLGKLSILTAIALPKSFTGIAVPSINHRVLKRARFTPRRKSEVLRYEIKVQHPA